MPLEQNGKKLPMTRLERAQGCLLGQLAGDSLGSLVEFRDADDIRRQYPDGVRDLADGGTFNTIAGQPTDDSEMALALSRRASDKLGRDLVLEKLYALHERCAAILRMHLVQA